jgi:diguanylate cyclase
MLPITLYVGVPLYGDGNRFFGTLCGLDPLPAVVGIRSSEGRVKRTADIIAKLLSMEQKLAKKQSQNSSVKGIAWRDEMTSLLNRRGWNRLLEKAGNVTDTHTHAVVILDLDKLKSVNDEKGHAAGDKLIVDAASVLSASMRGDDVVARLGGDEFGILLRDVYPRQMEDIVQRIAAELVAAEVAATMGYASSPPLPSISAAMEAADQMLISQKRQRSN